MFTTETPLAAATHVVLQGETAVDAHLSLLGLTAQLPPALGQLCDPCRTDRMPLGKQPAGGVHRDPSVEGRLPLQRGNPSFALVEEAEILDVEDLGDGEAVVDLSDVDVAGSHAGHLIGATRGVHGRGETDEPGLLVQIGVIGRDPEPGYVHRPVREVAGTLGRGEDHSRSTVGLRAAVEQTQRIAHRGSIEDLLGGDLVAEVRIGVEGAVVVVLDRHRGQHLAGRAELRHVSGGEGGEEHRGGFTAGVDGVSARRAGEQTFLGGLVAHLLHTDHEHDVVHARCNRHRADSEGVAAGGAGVLDPGAGDPVQPDGARDRVASDALLAPQRPALGGDEYSVDRRSVESVVHRRDCGVERAPCHVLIGLVEQLTHLDQPRADH